MSTRIVGRKVRRAAMDITEGVFSRTLDAALWWVTYLNLLPVAFSMNESAWKAQVEADNVLSSFGYDVLKRAIIKARHRGLLLKSPRHTLPRISETGRKRLSEIVPFYDPIRMWDKRLHVITYDVPEKQSEDRRLLRDYLRAISCGRLQDSVWITPFNPVDLVREYVRAHALSGTIIVSDVGTDGSVGDEDVVSLVARVFGLEKLNDRYDAWIAEVERHGKVDHKVMVSYLSILKDDPQLPFALLPKWWKGDSAYQLVKIELEKMSKIFRPEKY